MPMIEGRFFADAIEVAECRGAATDGDVEASD
jgi:hypothetical protein